jgi:ATP adenylyltransferase
LHPDLPHVHIVYPLGNLKSIPYPPTAEQSSQLVDELAPAMMKSLDIAIDSVRRGEGNKHGGWNLLMTL